VDKQPIAKIQRKPASFHRDWNHFILPVALILMLLFHDEPKSVIQSTHPDGDRWITTRPVFPSTVTIWPSRSARRSRDRLPRPPGRCARAR
jgi:hypothetical protein